MENEISFCELRKKEVVNAADGSRLGHIVDMIISVESKRALGIVAPGRKSGFFSKEQNFFIPLGCIVKIGEDVILINMSNGESPRHGEHCKDDYRDEPCREQGEHCNESPRKNERHSSGCGPCNDNCNLYH